jgi:hypothetical protein
MKALLGYALAFATALSLSGCGGGSSDGGAQAPAGNSGAVSIAIDLDTMTTTVAGTTSAPPAGFITSAGLTFTNSSTLTACADLLCAGDGSAVGGVVCVDGDPCSYFGGGAGASVAAGPTITAVSVSFTRTGFEPVAQDLTIANNTASGTISSLAAGYWHLTARVYAGEELIYIGEVDVNVIAGAQVSAQLLFDPVTPGTGETGSVAVTVGINPLPGYRKIDQFVSTILQDIPNGKLYILDNSTRVLGVYDASTLNREKDITLPATPQAIAVMPGGGALLAGYSSGKLFRLDVASEAFTQVADALTSINQVLPLSAKFALITSGTGWSSSNNLRVINLETAQIAATQNYMYPLHSLALNPGNGMVYALDSGISPADMHYIRINGSTGAFEAVNGSRYHGDYGFGGPLRIINGSRISAGSGNMFLSSTATTDDITYVGNHGNPYIDMAPDNYMGRLYVLNSDGIRKLLVKAQDTYFTTLTVDLAGDPKRVFNTHDSIVVFVQYESAWYVKILGKSSLGLAVD